MSKNLQKLGSVVASSSIFEKFISVLDTLTVEDGNLLRVLTYHRVDEFNARPWLYPGLISATPEVFAAQMQYLVKNYHLISVGEVLSVVDNPKRGLPKRSVLITFDDGYDDFEQHAWPVLKHYGIPVVLFVPTAFPDHPEKYFWWDAVYYAINNTVMPSLDTPLGKILLSTNEQRLVAYSRLKDYIKSLPNDIAIELVGRICSDLKVPPHQNSVLNWDSLKKLASEGVTLGAHTRNHPIMNHIPFTDMQNEAAGSLEDLQREVGHVHPVFAYPSGFHSPQVVDAVRNSGFKLAFTTENGINQLGKANHLRLSRLNIGTRTTLPVMRGRLLSWLTPVYPVMRKLSV